MKRFPLFLLLAASVLPLSAQAATTYKLYRYVPNLIVDNVPSGQTGGSGNTSGGTGGTSQPYVASWAAASPSALNFGSVAMGQSSALSVSVKNTGTQAQSLSASVTGVDASAFVASSSCTAQPGADCTINVTMTPKFESAHTAALSIGSTSIPLSGSGYTSFLWQAIPSVPASQNFGTVYLGEQGSVATYTFRNVGSATQTSTPLIVGVNPDQFTATTTCTNIAVSSTCQLRVNYVPTVMGAAMATVKFSTYSVNVRGSSSERPVAWSKVGTSGSPNFGSVLLTDSNYRSYTITYQNVGSATGSMPLPTLSDDDGFILNSTCSNVAAGQSCNVITYFSPSSAKTYTSVLTLVDGSTVNLVGVGEP